ncbi:primosomal protein N' [Pseudonocardia sp.]|uniref:primosomal protein N' n=1 Tax=Pseudonocardia sp. TaxID=60912 RepID=UPI003D0CF580
MSRTLSRGRSTRGEWRPAPRLPVARVAVDVALAHLDRPFDYRVPAHLDVTAVPGVRLRVRFAGRLVDAFLLDRVEESDHGGRLAWIERVVSPEPVLTAEIAALCRTVADRYAGVFADVVRMAVPPRHARVEAQRRDGGRAVGAGGADPGAAPADGASRPDEMRNSRPPDAQLAAAERATRGTDAGGVGAGGVGAGGVDGAPDGAGAAWGRYVHGPALLDALAGGRAAHAVWQALPGEDWPRQLAAAAAATAATGRGAVLVVPDQRDVDRLHAACGELLGAEAVVALTADLGPAERYRRWLRVLRGEVRVVVGTRAAAFAPVGRPGLLAVWDDGDDLHAEPRAPYPHARDVLVARAHAAGAALLVGGYARTAEGQLLVESGWAREVVAQRATVRAAAPRVTAPGESDAQLLRDPDARAARVPGPAFEAARAALAADRPVLVQVPRAGYLPWLACAACREAARCRRCAGPLAIPRGAAGPGAGATESDRAALPHCRWCGRAEPAFRCGACGSARLRAGAVGAGRTAEELGRAFPGVAVRSSGGGAPVLATVPGGRELVVATPGAEPVAPGGYGAALLLDGWALLARPDLRVAEETLRRWMAAAALVVPAADGGRVVVVAEPGLAVVQALVRWDPAGHAAAELAGRSEVGFPPAARMAAVEGAPEAVAEIVAAVQAEMEEVDVLGPVDVDVPDGEEPQERVLLRVARPHGRALAAALAAAQAVRTARKAAEPVRVRVDPAQL